MSVHPPQLCLVEYGLYAGFRFARAQQLLGGETIHSTAVQQSQAFFYPKVYFVYSRIFQEFVFIQVGQYIPTAEMR
jgi:hypothetical protein